MSDVPFTTATASDAWVARKELLDSNAILVQQKDTLLREVAQWQTVRDAIREEIAAHVGLPVLTETLHNMLSTTLMEQRDALRQEIEEKTQKSEDMDVRNTVLTKQISEKEGAIQAKIDRVATLAQEESEWTSKRDAAREEHNRDVEAMQNKRALVLEELNQATNHLTGVKIEEEVLLQNRTNEEMRLSQKSRDLAIYESRIREAAAKMDPPVNIIL